MEQLDEEEYTECPHCGAMWTQEEIDWQNCDYCGYPSGDGCLEEDYCDFDDE
jgi:hypothetical protein